jgi:hypothetical protein
LNRFSSPRRRFFPADFSVSEYPRVPKEKGEIDKFCMERRARGVTVGKAASEFDHCYTIGFCHSHDAGTEMYPASSVKL